MPPEESKSALESKPLSGASWVAPLAVGFVAGATVTVAALMLYPPLLGMLLPPGLVVTIPATSEADCKMKPPDGHRPLCAYTSWDEGLLECTIIGFNSGCVCYEGRTRPCKFSNPEQWCSPPSSTCGVKSCVVTSDTSSTWGACVSATAAVPTATAAPTVTATPGSP